MCINLNLNEKIDNSRYFTCETIKNHNKFTYNIGETETCVFSKLTFFGNNTLWIVTLQILLQWS